MSILTAISAMATTVLEGSWYGDLEAVRSTRAVVDDRLLHLDVRKMCA